MILAVSFIRYNPELSITNFRALLCTSQLLFFIIIISLRPSVVLFEGVTLPVLTGLGGTSSVLRKQQANTGFFIHII